MGFDVLAFESGFYDCRNAWRRMELGEDVHAQFRRCVFGIWNRSRQVQPLMDYLAAALEDGAPLELAGFDSQFTGAASREDLTGELRSLLGNLGVPILSEPDLDGFLEVLQHLTQVDYVRGVVEKPDGATQEAFRTAAASLGQAVAAADLPEPTRAFWVQLLRSTASHSRSAWEVDYTDPASTPDAFGIRDRQMGENLVWLAREEYPNRKIIVWAATLHNARNLGGVTVADSAVQELYRQFRPMGDYVTEALGEGSYSLGFTAYEGSAGVVGGEPTELDPPSAGSLEDLMARAGLENAFIDFRNPPDGGGWLRQPLVSRPMGYSEMEADWGSVMDGMVFTRRMTPSEATSGG
jgi:erythromycin esterase